VKINKQRSNDFRLPTTILSTKVNPDIPFVNLKLTNVRVRGYCPERFSIPLKVNKMNLINY
jgi:hypothetical protein